jgi:hypothetical protein
MIDRKDAKILARAHNRHHFGGHLWFAIAAGLVTGAAIFLAFVL